MSNTAPTHKFRHLSDSITITVLDGEGYDGGGTDIDAHAAGVDTYDGLTSAEIAAFHFGCGDSGGGPVQVTITIDDHVTHGVVLDHSTAVHDADVV